MNIKRIASVSIAALCITFFAGACSNCCEKNDSACCNSDYYGLTVIPPTCVTNQVDADVRCGVKNNQSKKQKYEVKIFCNGELLSKETLKLAPGEAKAVKAILETGDKVGQNEISATVTAGKSKCCCKGKCGSWHDSQPLEVEASDIRSTRRIDGAFMGFYHWSDQEGKMWNPTIKTLTAEQWGEVARSMKKLQMDIVVMQESFRNEEYVGRHNMETDGYHGRAFYDSQLYPGRMPIACADPIEAVMAEADKLGMHVFAGVGMYAWFDYTPGSLEWHKSVAKELWEKYGHHPSFYGFYVSEEGTGSLDSFESNPEMIPVRRAQIIDFYKEMFEFCHALAPDKPLMFAPNGWGVGRAFEYYPKLLANVDIICPFAFARMPEGDLTGVEAVTFLQNACNDAGAHLWLDLEAFLFDEKEGYLVPRPIEEIKGDLTLFDNFEKVVTYQYPGVFNDPDASVCIGERSTLRLFRDYQNYLEYLADCSAMSASSTPASK